MMNGKLLYLIIPVFAMLLALLIYDQQGKHPNDDIDPRHIIRLSEDHIEARIMFDQTGQKILFKWDEFPLRLKVVGDKNAERMRLLHQVLDELTAIAGREIIKISDEKDNSTMHLIFSQKGNFTFETKLKDFLKNIYGLEYVKQVEKEGGIHFPENPNIQCFTLWFFDKEQSQERKLLIDDKEAYNYYIKLNRTAHVVMNIGSLEKKSPLKVLTCLREELAHAAFFLPDWISENAEDTIFNAYSHETYLHDFSPFDKRLMRLLADDRIKNGMTRDEFIKAAEQINNQDQK